jgi:hypothetical protein
MTRVRHHVPIAVKAPLAALLLSMALLSVAGATPALATAPSGAWWRLTSSPAPTNMPSGSEGQILVSVANLGYEDAKASAENPIKVTDHLPAGLEVGAEGVRALFLSLPVKCPEASGQVVVCELPHAVPAAEDLEIKVAVRVSAANGSTLTNEVTVAGGEGEAQAEPLESPIHVSDADTQFGVESYELTPENEDGTRDVQAGTHPFQLTTTFNLNKSLEFNPNFKRLEASAPVLPRDLRFVLPPGLLGNITVVPTCSGVDFTTIGEEAIDLCPADTAIGTARVTVNEPNNLGGVITESIPVFNLAPERGEPARFGVEIDKVPVVFNTAVLTGSDYAVEVSAENAPQTVALLGTQVSLWGVPGSSRHDESRGWECLGHGHFVEGAVPAKPCQASIDPNPPAFLSLPTTCSSEPVSTVTGDSWPKGPGRAVSQLQDVYTFPSTLQSCDLLAFNPTIVVAPETTAASEPSGLAVDLAVPQASTISGDELDEADASETVVTLPPGVLANPGAANGLQACASEGIGLLPGFAEASQLENDHFYPGAASCPNGSKIGTATIETPLLQNPLSGFVYLAAQDTNLLYEKLVLYLIAEDPVSGVRVKLAGEVHVNPSTGQLTSTFTNTPPEPFSNLKLNFFGGPRASQSTPAQCASHTTQASFLSSSAATPVTDSSTFAITSGPKGSPCSNPQPFSPSFQAGSISDQAASLTQFSLTIGHPDADQWLSGVTVHLPPGVAALLATVTPCAEPSAGQEWSCGPESLIGHSSASSGLGEEPFTLPGQVYLTVGYDNAPFGLLVVTPANAGPFHLGDVDVRSRINVDPTTAAVTITSDPVPTFVKGVPVQLKQINVTIDREGFEFNPTNCAATAITGTLSGAGGASEAVSSPFQVANCAKLAFAPKLTASTGAQDSKAGGAALDVKVLSAGLGQANIAKVDLQLPRAMPSRLSTIQKACPEAVFNTNPASCDEGSNIGYATIHTPVLKSPLAGPAYLVSHGRAAFPDVELVLQGEEILLILDGKTDIKGGVTYSRFEAAPDAPFTSFETFLPAGPHSALTAYVPASRHFNVCGTPLLMPTEITGQNGGVIKQTTSIVASGCHAARPLTRAQRLANALKACRKIKKKGRRLACERIARKRYVALVRATVRVALSQSA